MTEEQSKRLQAAVNELNAAMGDINNTDGDATRVYPGTRFSDSENRSMVYVEVTTGRKIFGSSYLED